MHNIYLSIQYFISGNLNKVIILLIAAVTINFLKDFPYINTFLAFPYPWNSFLLLFLLTVVLFRLNETFTFRLALLLLGIAAVLSLFGKHIIAQTIGTIVYSLLWFGFIQMVFHLWTTKRET